MSASQAHGEGVSPSTATVHCASDLKWMSWNAAWHAANGPPTPGVD